MNHLFVACRCRGCQRTSQFPLKLLGEKSACRYCGKLMEVRDPHGRSAAEDDEISWWIRFTKSGAELSRSDIVNSEKTLPR
jgi:hypothetical protein